MTAAQRRELIKIYLQSLLKESKRKGSVHDET